MPAGQWECWGAPSPQEPVGLGLGFAGRCVEGAEGLPPRWPALPPAREALLLRRAIDQMGDADVDVSERDWFSAEGW